MDDSSLTPEGEEALKRALRIVEADPEASPQTRIDTLLQMGDWYQIKKLPREALPYYQRAWQLSRTAPYPPSSASTTLNVPVRVYYPQPQIVAHVPAVHAKERNPTTCRSSSLSLPMGQSGTRASWITTRATNTRRRF